MIIGKRECLNTIIWISLVQGFAADYLNLGFINYFCDLLIIICLIIHFAGSGPVIKRIPHSKAAPITLAVTAFAAVVFLGWIINGANILHALWGVRNYGRFFVFYYLCRNTFRKADYDRIIKWLFWLFPVHFAIVLYQLIVEKLSYDYLGGIFGRYQGCASGLMIYYGFIIILLFAKYDSREMPLRKILLYIAIILGSAAIAELKALFLYFIVILAVYVLLSRNKVKACVVLSIGVLGFIVGIEMLINFFPMYADFFSLENIIKQLTNKEASYTYREGLDIGRSSVFFKLDPILKEWGGEISRWFGLGLGNGDYSSSFGFLNSDFYNTYPQSNYVNFSLSFLFVETGYLGTIAYAAFFAANGIAAVKAYSRNKCFYTMLGVFVSLLCFFLMYYNCSLRTNYAYIVFALIAAIAGKTSSEDTADKRVKSRHQE